MLAHAPFIRWLAPVVVVGLMSLDASAGFINLTTIGSSDTDSQGAIFSQSSRQPTGTGVIQPFVRIQGTPVEGGYNTEGQIEFQTKDTNQWTSALPLDSLSKVTIGSTQYYSFFLDINESNNAQSGLLSLDDMRIYLGKSDSLTGINLTRPTDGFGSQSTKVYDLDANGDTYIKLNYSLSGGSGAGDMFAYIPVSLFANIDPSFKYVYLYSHFGDKYASNAGFEEWAALKGPTTGPVINPTGGGGAVPAPPGVVLAGMGLVGMLFGRRFRREAAPVA